MFWTTEFTSRSSQQFLVLLTLHHDVCRLEKFWQSTGVKAAQDLGEVTY